MIYQTVLQIICSITLVSSVYAAEQKRLAFENYKSQIMERYSPDIKDLDETILGYDVMFRCRDSQGAKGLPSGLAEIVRQFCAPNDTRLNQFCPCSGCCFCPQNQWPEKRVLSESNKVATAYARSSNKQEALKLLQDDAHAQAIQHFRNQK